MAFSKRGGVNAADSYWKAMADLHRLGIAHNDAHIDNILVDDKGKGRWVDMGLAQQSPKAALAEAMGIFNKPSGAVATLVPGSSGALDRENRGNWQTRRWNATGTSQMDKAMRSKEEREKFNKEYPVASRVLDNKGAAIYKLKSYGLDNNDVASIMEHGIRSPLSTYNKGVWSKLTDKQASEVLNELYNGI
jgi:serine/threonine protein kinase